MRERGTPHESSTPRNSSTRRRRPVPRPPGPPPWLAAVIGAVASVILSVVMLFAPWADAVESLVVGLLGLLVGLLVEVLLRLEALARGTSTLASAGPYAERLHETARLTGDVVRPGPPAWVRRELDRHLDDLSLRLTELGTGRLVTRDHQHLLDAMHTAKHEVLAVTNELGGGSSWWRTPLGRQYWEENLEALRRGVRIQRIFIHDEVDADLAALLTEQREAGIEVRTVRGGAIDPDLHRNLAVIDGRLTWEGRNNGRGVQDENVLSHLDVQIERLTRLYGRCALASTAPPP